MIELMIKKPVNSLFQSSMWNPMRDLLQMQRYFDRMRDDYAQTSFDMSESSFSPAMDLEETDANYLMSMDLPGVQKSDLKVEIINHQLVISGEKKREKKEGKSSQQIVERYHGTFRRTFDLPETVSAEKVEADFHDGVLRILIPKKEATRPKQIEINEAKTGFFNKNLERKEAHTPSLIKGAVKVDHRNASQLSA